MSKIMVGSMRLAPQQGTVLVLVLVVLLAMTMIGVTAMQGVTQEERMASNARQRVVAFQAAESGLRAAEAVLRQTPLPPFNGTWFRDIAQQVKSADLGSCDATTYWASRYCWNGTRTVQCDGAAPVFVNETCTPAESQEVAVDGSLAEQPRYVIERLSQLPNNASGSLQAGQAVQASERFLYRLTARGVGNSADAVVVLQSLYAWP